MKYFLIETNEKNRIPYNINKNHAIDIRMLNRSDFDGLPMWNIVEMDFPREGFFPDMICSPFLLLSEVYFKTVMMYQPDVPFKGIKLWNKESGINVTYMLVILDGLECMSDKTQFNSVGNRILKLVLNKEKVDTEAVFRFKECDKNGIIGRMDFVESILRRGVKGIKLTEIEVA